jgi:hypothetical protein
MEVAMLFFFFFEKGSSQKQKNTKIFDSKNEKIECSVLLRSAPLCGGLCPPLCTAKLCCALHRLGFAPAERCGAKQSSASEAIRRGKAQAVQRCKKFKKSKKDIKKISELFLCQQ